MNQNFTFKLFLLLFLSVLGTQLFAQQNVCEGDQKNYRTDTNASGTNLPDVSTATYTWKIFQADGITEVTTIADTDGSLTNNLATFDWNLSAGNYVLKVFKKNNTCPAEVSETLNVVVNNKPVLPTIDPVTEVCYGNDAVFTIHAANGNIVTYTINGVAATTTITANNKIDIIVPNTQVNQTMIITEVKSNNTANACSLINLNVTATITVGAQVTITPIQAL